MTIPAATPAKAGTQFGKRRLVGVALYYLCLSNWAPAFAGVARR